MRNNVFGMKQTRNKVLLNIFRGFKKERKIQLMFLIGKDTMKRKCYVFSCYKDRNKVCLVCLE